MANELCKGHATRRNPGPRTCWSCRSSPILRTDCAHDPWLRGFAGSVRVIAAWLHVVRSRHRQRPEEQRGLASSARARALHPDSPRPADMTPMRCGAKFHRPLDGARKRAEHRGITQLSAFRESIRRTPSVKQRSPAARAASRGIHVGLGLDGEPGRPPLAAARAAPRRQRPQERAAGPARWLPLCTSPAARRCDLACELPQF